MKFTALVLIADNRPDSMGESTTISEVSFVNPVNVTIEFNPRMPVIGSVTLHKDGVNVVGDFEIVDERAIAEHKCFVGYSPAIGGTVDGSVAVQHGKALLGMKINEVTLSSRGNSDKRILPLKGEGL